MKVFVNDRLEADIPLRARLSKNNERTGKLREEILEKAQGVFLWVVLAIRELLEGLDYEDSIDQLEKRLRLLPDDLNSLYANICSKIPKLYREEAGFFLRLMVVNSQLCSRKGSSRG